MDAATGRALDGADHLAQSIADILSTPIGSRVMRRGYGSLLPEMIDAPFNAATRLKLYGATALALMRWERRIRLRRVQITPGNAAGEFIVDLDTDRTDRPAGTEYTRITLPLRFRAH